MHGSPSCLQRLLCTQKSFEGIAFSSLITSPEKQDGQHAGGSGFAFRAYVGYGRIFLKWGYIGGYIGDHDRDS